MYVDCLGSFLKCRFQLSGSGSACDSVLLDANSAGLRATLRIVSVKRLLDDSNVQPALRTINGWTSNFRLGTMWAQKWNKPIKKHSSIKESLYPKSELSLSCKPHSFVLTFKSKRKGHIFFLKKGTSSYGDQNRTGYCPGRAAHSMWILHQSRQHAPALAPTAPSSGMLPLQQNSAFAGSFSSFRSAPQVPLPTPLHHYHFLNLVFFRYLSLNH